MDVASLEERISRLEENGPLCSVNDNGIVYETQYVPVAPNASEESPRSGADSEGYLTRSSPAIGLLAAFARSEDVTPSAVNSQSCAVKGFGQQTDKVGNVDLETENNLFQTYQDKVHRRYPFLRLADFRGAKVKRPNGDWVGFFVNMIFSIGILLQGTSHFEAVQHRAFYRIAVTKHLFHVFAQADRLLHIQAYLLLAMHAMYSPSTERIISLSSAAMRYCVMAQLHLADAEPEAVDAAAKSRIQMRRRVFWSAYVLDRSVGTSLDLPLSIPDYQITVKLYTNANDDELDEGCAVSEPEDSNQSRVTSVSVALHLLYCRQIQSEILNTTLHRDFGKQFDRLSDWRLHVLGKLDRWKSLCHRYSDPRSRSFTGGDGLQIIYNYSLAMLYQPTKTTVTGVCPSYLCLGMVCANSRFCSQQGNGQSSPAHKHASSFGSFRERRR